MSLSMKHEEICREYRLAADPNAQIKILAELNDCSEQQIIDILAAAGEISGTPQAKSKKPAKGRKDWFNWTVELEKELISLYECGMKPSEIAERLGIDRTAVANKISKLKRAGYLFKTGNAAPVIEHRTPEPVPEMPKEIVPPLDTERLLRAFSAACELAGLRVGGFRHMLGESIQLQMSDGVKTWVLKFAEVER